MVVQDRTQILPEKNLPNAEELIAQGRELGQDVIAGLCPFLTVNDVKSEYEYKQKMIEKGKVMLHAQIGYRSLKKTQHAFIEIYDQLNMAGYEVDRYGICLDWSMGYPAEIRGKMPKGTGLILNKPEDFSTLTKAVPVAPHFGDFMIGTPAAVENTVAALRAGATSVGNLGQYFTFRMPHWSDDVGTTAETLKALVLCSVQPVEIMIHSNLDDGFAALFCDMSCSIGAVLIEKYIIEELIGGYVAHCYGHTFSDPLTRLAFQRALVQVTKTPGSMVYGNTTIYGAHEIENYANLGSYLLVDVIAQLMHPTGHGLNPVPITEALHIPEAHEIIAAHRYANQLIQRAEGFKEVFDINAVDRCAKRLVEGGKLFKDRVINGLAEAGIDITNPFELLLSIRRIGARKLEEFFGPGEQSKDEIRGRIPVVQATTLNVLEKQSEEIIANLDKDTHEKIENAGFTACSTCTDVHEYGKLLVEEVLKRVGVTVIDAGVSVDPKVVIDHTKNATVDFITISTYSGVALTYLESLYKEMKKVNMNIPVFIGGKLTQIMEESESSIPIDVSEKLLSLGAIVCIEIEDMLQHLSKITEVEIR